MSPVQLPGPPTVPPPPPFQPSPKIFAPWATRWLGMSGIGLDFDEGTIKAQLPALVGTAADVVWAALCASGFLGNPIDHPPLDCDWSQYTEVVGYMGPVTPTAPNGTGAYAVVNGKVIAFSFLFAHMDLAKFGDANGISL